MTYFEKWISAGGLLVAAVGGVVAVANYRHTVEHDKEQEEQAKPPLTSVTKGPTRLPNLDNVPRPQTSKVQSDGQLDSSVEQAQNGAHSKSYDERQPFTFWGNLPSGRGGSVRPGIEFEVKSCPISRTLLTCIMTATSPRYDRKFNFDMFSTTITDSDGDVFRIRLTTLMSLQLDRDSPVPIKLEFPVNKDLVKPIVVRINGYVATEGRLENASFRIE